MQQYTRVTYPWHKSDTIAQLFNNRGPSDCDQIGTDIGAYLAIVFTSIHHAIFLLPVHTEKSFRNLIKTNRDQIVFSTYWLIWNQMNSVHLFPNQSDNGKYNLILFWINHIPKRFLCVTHGVQDLKGLNHVVLLLITCNFQNPDRWMARILTIVCN